ncbi:WhiB family transcriptional regulator [Streptacidiphilus sp. N1-3]|uniref:WhiB family transcriptional regulator n=1 Tax=Streptacidiphilus alkalitolerans TaxID=3342712 RepID=A0ABV6XCS1_9ACTN
MPTQNLDPSRVPYLVGHGQQPKLPPTVPCQQDGIDPDMFFPESVGEAQTQALTLCFGCGFQERCLRYALDNPQLTEWGIWGGTTAPRRQQLREEFAIVTHPNRKAA